MPDDTTLLSLRQTDDAGNSHYRNTILAVLIAFGLVLLAGFGLWSYFTHGQSTSQTVQVFAGGQPVEGASVQVVLGGTILATGVTDSAGQVTLSGLPAQNLKLLASKESIGVTSQAFTPDASTLTVSLSNPAPPSATTTSAFSVSVRDASSARALGAVNVTFQTQDGLTGSALTNFAGEVKLALTDGVPATFTLSRPGYKTVTTKATPRAGQTLSFKLSQFGSGNVQLTRPTPTPGPGGTTGTIGSGLSNPTGGGFSLADVYDAAVLVTDADGKPVDGGTATLVDSAYGVSIGTAKIHNGTALFNGLDLTRTAYPNVDAPGFEPFVEPSQARALRSKPAFKAVLTRLGSVPPTTFTTLDSAQTPVSSVVYVLRGSNALIATLTTDNDGNASVELPDLATLNDSSTLAASSPGALDASRFYSAVAVADGKVLARSARFQSGDAVTLTLQDALANNSATLTANVVDEDGTPGTNASVSIVRADGSFVLPDRTANETGETSFERLPLDDYVVSALLDGREGRAKATLQNDSRVDVHLQSAPALVTLNALDYSTLQPLAAHFETLVDGSNGTESVVDACDALANQTCTLQVPSRRNAVIRATEPGFVDYRQFAFLQPRDHAVLTVPLKPSVLGQTLGVSLVGVFDSNRVPVTTLKIGGTYRVQFSVTLPPGFDEAALYVRGDDAVDVPSSTVTLTERGLQGLPVTRASSAYRPAGPLCQDEQNPDSVDGQYKWAQVALTGSGETRVDVYVHVAGTVQDGQTLPVSFRVQARKGGVYARDPYDASLGEAQSTAEKADCYADVKTQTFTAFLPAELIAPPAKKKFTPSLTVNYDPDTGTLSSDQSSVTLQIDDVFAADALPVNVSPSVLVQPFESNAKNSTASCYSFVQTNETTGFLAFRAADFGSPSTCPIRVQGNTVMGDTTAALVFGTPSNASARLRIPILVQSSSLGSAFGRPVQLTVGDHSLKLLYLLNEKQAPRVIAYSGLSSRKVDVPFNGAGVTVHAWDGQPNLQLTATDQNKLIATWTYNQQPWPYKDIPVPIIECAAFNGPTDFTDFLACTDTCCSTAQYSRLRDVFARKAADVAGLSAFRRGNGEPYRTLDGPGSAFSFYTVAQLQTGVDPLQGAVEQGDGDVGNESKPGVYVLKASTIDAANWTYEASLANLPAENYLNPSTCVNGAPANQPLNGYLYGNGNCLEATDSQQCPKPSATGSIVSLATSALVIAVSCVFFACAGIIYVAAAGVVGAAAPLLMGC